jgi:hypothetical protein
VESNCLTPQPSLPLPHPRRPCPRRRRKTTSTTSNLSLRRPPSIVRGSQGAQRRRLPGKRCRERPYQRMPGPDTYRKVGTVNGLSSITRLPTTAEASSRPIRTSVIVAATPLSGGAVPDRSELVSMRNPVLRTVTAARIADLIRKSGTIIRSGSSARRSRRSPTVHRTTFVKKIAVDRA